MKIVINNNNKINNLSFGKLKEKELDFFFQFVTK